MRAHPDPRFEKRLPCKVKLGDTQYAGMVMNLSRSGLFVQTGAVAAPGAVVDVSIAAPSSKAAIALSARIVWKRMVPASLRATLAAGFGVAIESAPDAYYAFLDAVARLQTMTPRSPRARGEGDQYRVRLQQFGSRRSRTLELHAETEAIARHRALAMAGRDWAITQVDRPRTR
jgi:Tfp pilus assembly protein PilZ